MSKIFLTGASGLLGANLTRRLLRDGHSVTVLLREGSGHPFLDESQISIVRGDICDQSSFQNHLTDIDCVFHMAGLVSYLPKDRKTLYAVNADGTKNILEACKNIGVKKVVYTSSTAAIGIPPIGQEADEGLVFADAFKKVAYMDSKRIGEEYALEHCNDLDVIIVCPSTIFGPGDTKMNSGQLFSEIKKGMPIAPCGGTAVVGVHDCVDGHILAWQKGVSGERYILTLENIELRDLINRISKLLHKKPVNTLLPYWFFSMLDPVSRLVSCVVPSSQFNPDVLTISKSHRYFSANKAQQQLGWIPKQTLEDILKEAVEFYEDNNLM